MLLGSTFCSKKLQDDLIFLQGFAKMGHHGPKVVEAGTMTAPDGSRRLADVSNLLQDSLKNIKNFTENQYVCFWTAISLQ